MKISDRYKEILKKFLLGSLDDAAAEEIDIRIIAEPDFQIELEIAENALIEDFLERNLTREEEILFFDNFLVNDRRRENLKDIRMFKRYAEKHYPLLDNSQVFSEKKMPGGDKSKGFFSFFFTRRTVPAWALILIVVTVGLTWLFFRPQQTSELTKLEREYNEINRKNVSETAKNKNLTTISLMPGIFRDENAGSKLNYAEMSDQVLFSLGLVGSLDINSVEVELNRDQTTVFKQNNIAIIQNKNGQEARLILPKAVLEKGRYKIVLHTDDDQNTSITYLFLVE